MRKALLITGLTLLAPAVVLAQGQANQFTLTKNEKPNPVSINIDQKNIAQMFLIMVEPNKTKNKMSCPYDVGFRVTKDELSNLSKVNPNNDKTPLTVTYNGKAITSQPVKIGNGGNVFVPCLSKDNAETIKNNFKLSCKQNPALGLTVCALNTKK